MTTAERNFTTFEITDNPAELAGGVLREMARAFDVPLPPTPTQGELHRLMQAVGPAEWLRDNITDVQARLSRPEVDPTQLAAGWVEQSGVLREVERSYDNPRQEMPSSFGTAMFVGGVARWMLRRADRLGRFIDDGGSVDRVIIAAGNREMRPSEHDLVRSFTDQSGNAKLPTEYDFAERILAPMLTKSNMPKPELIAVDSTDGPTVLRALAGSQDVLAGTVLAVGNAGSVFQMAGDFRAEARALKPDFDRGGNQLYVTSDSIPLAISGEGPETHQNPFTALGILARAALALRRNQ